MVMVEIMSMVMKHRRKLVGPRNADGPLYNDEGIELCLQELVALKIDSEGVPGTDGDEC
jgi:hypothetical protein